MELWIRSQNKMNLVCVYSLYVIEREFAKNDSIWWEIFCNDEISLGLYLKERALEVLDEIQNKIRGKFLLKQKTILKPETVRSAKVYFEDLNNIDLIAGDTNFDIVPIDYTDAVIYEMPEK